jgi:endonuclease/exonuclease/phosphatase family metal-dependent hydrolase
VPDAVDVEWRRSTAGETYLRGEDLYDAARRYLGREPRPHGVARSRPTRRVECEPRVDQPASALRVMTYNIHSCIGLDGRVQPERVLRVIRAASADVVALQEVDANRQRSRRADQAQFLAVELGMSHHYFAVLEDRGERYGLAVISRFPLRVVQMAHLTPADARRRSEARGAMWVELDTSAGKVQLINTHFGLTGEERRRQAAALAGEAWLGKMSPIDPVILCGDLNSGPRSPACRVLGGRLRDAHCVAALRRRGATFPSLLSMRRIDHIFVSEQFRVAEVFSPRTPTAVLASDHLPVCADLELVQPPATGKNTAPTPQHCVV